MRALLCIAFPEIVHFICCSLSHEHEERLRGVEPCGSLPPHLSKIKRLLLVIVLRSRAPAPLPAIFAGRRN